MATQKSDHAPLNQTPCPACGKHVMDRAVACPHCGEKIYVEHPGGITPTRHRPLTYPNQED
ncbi:MAG: zinc ribbon domain-containing protein [Rhodopirellula sp. JB044]|uniref:zinc ribbon domain-containing protein n=1 Tax=Rhodopirellula sp. JB044 TaxID=3342844 RepID=UPI003709DFC8